MKENTPKTKMRIPKLLKNRFFIAGLFFVIWMLFIDNYSYLEHRVLNEEIEKLEENKAYFQEQIRRDREAIRSLKNSDATEKYAREKYYMKRENEDIYIIETDTIPTK
ncbi:FtsB family cell division protein [Myroides guanonis]|uniref:Septum formation initiator n=1 Tax=Myroides guanonis TaxID=1150112 RepID=A0A1I3NA24_9FLAO|nr:septum formation initiator family protein [Myroides guanonis]SFJ06138.1 Septum formation initiator [Myroides guanonis]